MSRTARPWMGAGPLSLGGLLLTSSLAAAGADPATPPLSRQLVGLGRQAAAQGHNGDATKFYKRALALDPRNVDAREALTRVALRQAGTTPPAPPTTDASGAVEPPAPPADEQKTIDGAPVEKVDQTDTPNARPDDPTPVTQPDAADPVGPGSETTAEAPVPVEPRATIEGLAERDRVAVEQLTADIRAQMARARELVRAGDPDAALDTLRLAQNALQTTTGIPEEIRARLTRDLQTEFVSTGRAEEIVVQNRAEALRIQATAEQQARTLEQLNTNEININALMTQFDTLMEEGTYNVLYNGGTGDLVTATAPFYSARLLAQHARALDPNAAAPRAGLIVAQTEAFLAQSLGFNELKRFRYMLTLADVDRASVPFPDDQIIEYPSANVFREISERRIKRYESTDLVNRDPKTVAILEKLNQPVSIPFEAETPLNEVIKYIQDATADDKMPKGIPIYIDPIGLQEHERTETSPVTLNLEGVPLKTSLKLLLKQLDLIYTVKDGLMTITSKDAEDTPTEIRVYPVADLAIIPRSLLGGGGGGGGGMGGGGMGGGGMGGGGMGGGGMGGGGGGMGGGGGGFGCLPVDEPTPAEVLSQKKSN